MCWRSVFRGSGAYPGWMARSDVLAKGRWETRTVVRATAVWCRLGPNKGLTFVPENRKALYPEHRAASLAIVLRLKKSGFKSPKHCTRALHLSRG